MRESVCVLIPLQRAQAAIRTLRKLRLIDDSLEFTRTEAGLFIPLLHEPTSEDTASIKEQCDHITTQRELFTESPRKPQTLRETLRNKIPASFISSLPTSFDVVGDISIIELPEELGHYAFSIGSEILRLNPSIRLVLQKKSEIAGKFRTRQFLAIAGTGTTETLYREFSCRYRLNVGKVYFNPRLSHERMRVAAQVGVSECVVDMFAGVGPYSILIAKMQADAKVHALDLNPDAYRYLKENIFLNRVADRVIPTLGDARELVEKKLRGTASRVIMNLPTEALGFIDAAVAALGPNGGTIHYYTFASRDDEIVALKDVFQKAVKSCGRVVREFSFCKPIKEVAPNRVQVAADAVVV